MTAPATVPATEPPGVPTRPADGPTFTSTEPATGAVVGTFPVDDEASVRTAVATARTAARWWAELGFAGRKQRLLAWRTLLAGRMDELARLIHRETGKPLDDALLEVALVLEHLDWAAKNARRVLGRRSVPTNLLAANHSASLRYAPYGVVGVIGPWNYPAYTPMGSIAYALAAGNTVVFKPSELTPAVGAWLAASAQEAIPEQPVLQVVTGDGATGGALCTAGVDKVAFTGSTATGKRVMAACSESLTPVLVECGGKDALIVAPDADLEAAAQAAVWGGMANAGQTCVGVERVYVHTDVYDALVTRIAEVARSLRPGSSADASYGPMTLDPQVDVVRRHVEEALANGARAVVGGTESVRPPYVDPIVLTDVPDDCAAVQEETFGPLLVITRVASTDEAVRRANATPYGLAATVFAGKDAEAIAERLRCGMVSVNSVLSFTGIPALPFGGVGASGFGRIHGEDGLREFAHPQSIARLRGPAALVLTSFDRHPEAVRWLSTVLRKRFRA